MNAPGSPRLLVPDELGFEAAVRGPGPNALPPDRVPAAVVSPVNDTEVATAIRAAGRKGRQLAVRSGGHSWISSSVRDGSVLLDLAALDRIDVDPIGRKATIGPGATSRTVSRELARHGLAFPLGHCGGPGMGGYLLGGGIGLNWIAWGAACAWVRRVHAVTAGGDVVTADEHRHPDLLWLARGSGPGFPAVATGFEVALTDRPSDTRVSRWTFHLTELEAVTSWVAGRATEVGQNVEVTVAIEGPRRILLPPSKDVPDHVVRVTATAFAEAGKAPAALGPLRDPPPTRPLAQDLDVPVAFEDLHLAVDASFPHDHRYVVDTFWVDASVHDALTPIAQLVTEAPSARTRIHTIVTDNRQGAGASIDEGAFTLDGRTLVVAYLAWLNEASDEANRSWLRRLACRLAPQTTGHFVSETDLTMGGGRAERSYAPAAWERLRKLRRSWDPEGRLHGFLDSSER
jgi:FAD/FMN-containing dehydrogenase